MPPRDERKVTNNNNISRGGTKFKSQVSPSCPVLYCPIASAPLLLPTTLESSRVEPNFPPRHATQDATPIVTHKGEEDFVGSERRRRRRRKLRCSRTVALALACMFTWSLSCSFSFSSTLHTRISCAIKIWRWEWNSIISSQMPPHLHLLWITARLFKSLCGMHRCCWLQFNIFYRLNLPLSFSLSLSVYDDTHTLSICTW